MANVNEKVLTGAGLTELWGIIGEHFGGLRWHWWKYREKPYEVIETSTSNLMRSWMGTVAPTWYRSDGVAVLDDGSITLLNPQAVQDSATVGTYTSTLAGKYFSEKTDGSTPVYKGGSGCKVTVTSSSYGSYPATMSATWTNIFLVTSQATGADATWHYCHSAERNAYPDQGEQDGLEYLYLGVPLYNAIDGVKMQTGEYVGTGTSGTVSGGQNSITFDFEPLLVIIGDTTLQSNENNTPADITMFLRGVSGSLPTINQSSYSVAKWSGNTLSWYGQSGGSSDQTARNQLNVSGHTYRWMAIRSM